VQRSEEDPNVFDISYQGSHVCSKGNGAVLSPKLADTEEEPQGCGSNVQFHYAESSQEKLRNCANTLSVETDNITPLPFPSFGCMAQDNHHTFFPSLVLENDPFFTTISQTSLLSPNTTESNYFVPDASTTNNSPTFDFNFSLDANLPFNASGFYPKCT